MLGTHLVFNELGEDNKLLAGKGFFQEGKIFTVRVVVVSK